MRSPRCTPARFAATLPTPQRLPDLVERHLHTPYAYPALRQQLEASAEKVVRNYLDANRALFDKIEFSEKQIEISLGGGVSVNGRIDLVRRIDTGETTIVDLKSTDRAQPEEVTETQLHIYALGYQELTGRRPDYVEIYELDEGKRKPRSVDDDFLNDVKVDVRRAAAGPAHQQLACGRRRERSARAATIAACAPLEIELYEDRQGGREMRLKHAVLSVMDRDLLKRVSDELDIERRRPPQSRGHGGGIVAQASSDSGVLAPVSVGGSGQGRVRVGWGLSRQGDAQH